MRKMKIDILDLGEGLEVLSGQPRGQLFLGKLLAFITPQDEYTPVFLDFRGVKVVTGSFWRSAILAFRDHCVMAGLNLYPILANISDEIAEDLKLVLEPRGDAFMVCDLSKQGQLSSLRIVGSLDDTQRVTLNAVIKAGETDANTLKDEHDKEQGAAGIGVTGWNNRLTSLAQKGLLIEVKKGRTKVYRPIVEFT